jgi:hypothetical protein
MVHLRHADDGSVTHANPPGLGRHGGEEHLGRRTMGVLFEKMVLHGPDVVKTELVRQPALLQGI